MKDLSLVYYADVRKDEDGFTSGFKDIPGVFAEGDTLEECLYNSCEALEGMLLAMIDDGDRIPEPSLKREGEHPIYVKPEIAAPVLLHQLREERKMTMGEVAGIMRVPYQRYQRLEKKNNITLKSLDRAVKAMGGQVEIVVHMN